MSINTSLISILQNLITIAMGIIGIGFLIGFHELGHFLFCKLFNIRTPSFSIGFGPKIFSRKIGETLFSLSAIPLGGYVEIAGAAEVGQGEQKDALSMDSESFAIKPYYQKLFVLLGGIFFNLIFAYCAFIMLFSIGMSESNHFFPLNTQPTIATIIPESAAEKSNLAINDILIAIDNIPVNGSVITAINAIRQTPHDHITITIDRAGEQCDIPLSFNENNRSLGVTFVSEEISAQPLLTAIKNGIKATNLFILQTIMGFKQLFTGRNLKQMAGPIAIIGMISKSAGIGFAFFIFLLAIISINLAILNLIPIPILDGGQILFYTIEAVAGRQLPVKVKEYIHIACWILFLGLTIYLSAHDIIRIVQNLIQ